MKKTQSGFNLLELTLVLALLGILVSLSLPGIKAVFSNIETSRTISTVVSTLNFARVTAVSRGYDVFVKFQANSIQVDMDFSGGKRFLLSRKERPGVSLVWHGLYPLYFTALGEARPNGRVEIYKKAKLVAKVVLSQSGRIRSLRIAG